jgi:hypothetical protein
VLINIYTLDVFVWHTYEVRFAAMLHVAVFSTHGVAYSIRAFTAAIVIAATTVSG